jgi:feruloyl-CoA synthase
MTSLAARRDDLENLFALPAIVADRRADGSIVLRSTDLLQPSTRCVGDWLEQWAARTPDRIFLGERASVDAPWASPRRRSRRAISTSARC